MQRLPTESKQNRNAVHLPIHQYHQIHSHRYEVLKQTQKRQMSQFGDSILAVLRVEDDEFQNTFKYNANTTHTHTRTQCKIELKPIGIIRMCKFIWCWFVLLCLGTRWNTVAVCVCVCICVCVCAYCLVFESCNKCVKFIGAALCLGHIISHSLYLGAALFYSHTHANDTCVNEK